MAQAISARIDTVTDFAGAILEVAMRPEDQVPATRLYCQ
jgi:hypothetical protein